MTFSSFFSPGGQVQEADQDHPAGAQPGVEREVLLVSITTCVEKNRKSSDEYYSSTMPGAKNTDIA